MKEQEELIGFAEGLPATAESDAEYCWVLATGKCEECGKEVTLNEIYPLDEKREHSYQVSTKNCPVCKDWVRVHVLPTERIGLCPVCDGYLDGMDGSHYIFLAEDSHSCPSCGKHHAIRLDSGIHFLSHEDIVKLVEGIFEDGPR
jgi:ssDNA-binding Zn-finger/Zn-ribbon topoisomerase 1